MTAAPDPLELELLPETQNYRASRLQLWTELVQRHREDRDRALQHGATPEQATKYANERMRGELAVFVWDLLPHAHRDAAALFFEKSPAGWIQAPEILLPLPLVPDVIARSYSKALWAQGINQLTREYAEDRARLEKHSMQVMESFFGSAAAAAVAVGNGLGAVGQGVGTAVGGVGEGIGALGRGLGAALQYLPLALAALGLGALGLGIAKMSSPRNDDK